uniref:Uncharacterized protein n=1 Tax=Anguilla anguilla TaxID=7936 RepID=A0A0E9SWH7_ANGAN
MKNIAHIKVEKIYFPSLLWNLFK